MSNSAPVPSKVHFITQLRSLPAGDKVRFIGCVNHYNETSAILELFHNYPLQKSATRSTVHLDITDVLELVKREDIEAGAWLNIVGYIQPSTDPSTRNGPKGVRTVKAIMLWSAGSINLAEYESALTERQET